MTQREECAVGEAGPAVDRGRGSDGPVRARGRGHGAAGAPSMLGELTLDFSVSNV